MDFRGLIKELVGAHVGEFVVCSGARNAALVVALSRTEAIHLWQHFEERSAAFFALGRTMETELPCAIMTTSGTAAAELLPAVIEAHYQGRPVVVITADRPREFRGSGAPQAIEQSGLFADYVAQSFDLEFAELEKFSLKDWDKRSVVHLNVGLPEGFDASEILGLSYDEVEKVVESVGEFNPAFPKLDLRPVIDFLQEVWQGVVVMVGGLRPADQEEVLHFLKKLNAPVIVDPDSGLQHSLRKVGLVQPEEVLHADLPGKVLRIGDVPLGRFWRDLEDLPEVEVLSITRTGFSGLARTSTVVEADVGRAIRLLGEQEEITDVLDHLRHNNARQTLIDELVEAFPSSEPALLREVSIYASLSGRIYLGNSMPIRLWALFAQTQVETPEIIANRGANGIDGQLSTWIGATTTDAITWGVFGDLTTFYDLVAPTWLEQLKEIHPEQKRVLVIINNGGGKIFERLPRVQALEEESKEIITQPHKRSLKGWAEWMGAHYIAVKFPEDIELDEEADFQVLEIFPDNKETDSLFSALSKK